MSQIITSYKEHRTKQYPLNLVGLSNAQRLETNRSPDDHRRQEGHDSLFDSDY